MTIEQARKALELRTRLDDINRHLTATLGDPKSGGVHIYFPSASNWAHWLPSVQQRAEILEIRRRSLNAERLMILAEAAELGLVITDAPPPPPVETPII